MSKPSRREFVVGAAGLAAASSCRTQAAAGQRFELDEFVAEVKRARSGPDAQRAVHEVLARVVSDPSSVLRSLGEPHAAGIHQVHRAPDLTILNVVWAPMMVLFPHEHRMWATIGIYTGREDNILWKREGRRVEACGASSLSEREVFSLPEDAVHSVINPIERMTGALHIYGGDFFDTPRNEWDSESLTEQPFDLERARRVFAEANQRFDLGKQR